ncbi:hypothetical protein GCM10007242_45560 [Pigmentiphaga litoralis]|uniref:hypothetical protein n=1 Tax=Pigmentiphaga litoralis TaxID=516702 RepID=UPI001677C149|nr:hypothetical protein [Pigmentiphaga litoralis]GGX33294.1 hypothetical protein GCM10007242_45560 [Pigmentiphaga litoralis]
MDATFYITGKAVIAFLCWLTVAAGATLAVFAPTINDTLLERIALSAIAITAVGAAVRILASGWVTSGGTALALSLAMYVVVVVIKHTRRYES